MGFIMCISTDSWYHSTFYHFSPPCPALPTIMHLPTTHHLAHRLDCIRLALEVVRSETAGLDVA
jgi:hypothetical protein